jgi:hypothetical protein
VVLGGEPVVLTKFEGLEGYDMGGFPETARLLLYVRVGGRCEFDSRNKISPGTSVDLN